jgi:hypothetical protein
MSLGWATKAKTIDQEMMRDVLADMDLGSPTEKTDLPRKFIEEPKRVIARRPPVLTLKDPPLRSQLTKVAIASVVLLALGWTGVHFDFVQRLTFSVRDIAAAVKSYVNPEPTPGSLAPATPDGSHDSLMGTHSKTPADDKNPDVPLQGRADASPPGRDPTD